jgi:inner membrane protein
VDNVTHTLAGLVVAQAALHLRARHQQIHAPLHMAAPTLSALANNAPDLDFLYRGITPGRLGYLLHHRGHTHTLLAALPLGLLCFAGVVVVLRLLGRRLTRSDAGFLLAVAIFGGVLHVTMDFGNNYGVHPFWPLDDHWYYGDAIFIIEPWLLITLGGIAFGASRRAVSRGLLALVLAGLLLVAWLQALGPGGVLRWPLALLLTLGAGLWLAWMHAASPAWRRGSGVVLLVLGMSVQLLARQQARAHVRHALGLDPAFELVSLVATPLPANPLCWSVLAVGRVGTELASEEYVVQQASVSAWPAVWSASACPWLSTDTTAPLASPAPPRAAVPGIVWGREFRAPLGTLRRLVQGDCVARGFARFARVPFWIGDGQRVQLIGDLRYDRSRADEFAEIRLRPERPSEQRCPRFVPPWRPPLPLLEALVP